MSMPVSDADTKAYFESVMESWQKRSAEGHPYAENKSWQRKFSALSEWIATLDLFNSHVLEVGCGTGLLQDLVEDYVGMDIALNSRVFMHKPFCVGTGTLLPFRDNEFDAVWSIWVLEHVSNPEQMLNEMRRVTKHGGSVFLCAGYAIDDWVATGLHKRSFEVLTARERLLKFLLFMRRSRFYRVCQALPGRLADLTGYLWTHEPSALRIKALQPNYGLYWDYDADATASLDAYNVALYFLTRGDRSYFRGGIVRSLFNRSEPQAYVINKNND